MNLLPQVKKMEIKEGFLTKKYIAPYCEDIDYRLKKAIDKLPVGEDGAKLVVNTCGTDSEEYTLEISADTITITSQGLNGAFYGIQTLRQILREDTVPCLFISDAPDFGHRGLYHDITRGKIPKLETLKKLIDDMAYYKLNSFQLYVEHVFEFEETKELIKKTGYITKEEITELDEYCHENFIEFIPSIATFGHMYEILEQERYKHLRLCQNVKNPENFWRARMAHHTIDPRNDESYELVKSLIEQYEPLFRSDKFNICGDETFDLENYGGDVDPGKLYVDFIQKIIGVVKAKNKKVMMWADILLKHPETLEFLPDDIYYLNWDYAAQPREENIVKLAETGKKQIVCPGTGTWSRFCENVEVEEKNISRMIEYGYKHGAMGVLNTNWGDFANPASIELAMYGIVLGAAKSWAVDTKIDDEFYNAVNSLVYGDSNAVSYLKRISAAHTSISKNWNLICSKYFEVKHGRDMTLNTPLDMSGIPTAQRETLAVINELREQTWKNDEYREEMLLCAESIYVLAQIAAKLFGGEAENTISMREWIEKYKTMWLLKNKESEISKIEEMVLYIADNL